MTANDDSIERFSVESLIPSEGRIKVISEHFPEAVGEDGINIDALARSLGEWVAPGPERFGLHWPGKAACTQIIQEPSIGTLAPMKDESVDWDHAENVIIEGDNLEVLKLLQRAYHGKVKLIYIDPPYNTGKEFIYPDNFKEGLTDYLRYSGQVDSEGLRISANAETDGRYHSKWLSMMYPRLFLARNLLRDDGVLFVSIDDHEVHNLRLLLDEIYGPENFIATLVWNTEGHTDNQFQIKVMHEYIHVYARSAASFEAGYVVDPNTRGESNLWKGVAENSITKNGPANPPSWVELPIGFPCKADELVLEEMRLDENVWQELERVEYIRRDFSQRHGLSYPLRKSEVRVSGGSLTQPTSVFSGWANRDKLSRYIDNGCEPLVEPDGSTLEFFLSDRGVIYYRRHREGLARNIVSVLRGLGTVERARSNLEARQIYFDYPKPVELLQYLIRVSGARDDDLVLDFFAGSGTTAEAVAAVNAEDGDQLRWMLVQLPEPVVGADHELVSEIPVLRMNLSEGESALPVEGSAGFRAFRLAESNFRVWGGAGAVDDGGPVSLFADGTADSATDEGIVAELLLKAGFEFSESIAHVQAEDVSVDSVADNQLLIVADEQLTLGAVEAMVAMEPALILILDRCFGDDDELKVNTMQTVRAANQAAGTNITLKVV